MRTSVRSKDQVASQQPRTLAEAVVISCMVEEVLNEEYGPMSKDKTKVTTTKDQSSEKNKEGSKHKNDEHEPKKDISLSYM